MEAKETVIRDFNTDLANSLRDPECAAYFANAQAESARELLECGVITELDETSSSSKTRRSSWKI